MITTTIARVVETLHQHNIAAIPTETVYGLAAIAAHEDAVKKIFALKQRPLNHPLILHIAAHFELAQWVSAIHDHAQILIENLWPGPLTLVFNCRPNSVSPLVNGGQNTIAIRCPSHPVTSELLKSLGVPVVAPSANPFGKISPTTALHVEQSFDDPELMILDGGRCGIGIESTIVDVSNPRGYRILRHGIIPETTFNALLPNAELPETNSIRVPGRLEVHYQPKKQLHCFSDLHLMSLFCAENPQCYVLSFHKGSLFENYWGAEMTPNPEQLAYELYFELRRADVSDSSCIVMELPPEGSEWAGIRERLLKAGIWHQS